MGKTQRTSTLAWHLSKERNPYLTARKALNLTQQELATAVNASDLWIYRHENGLINTPSSTLTIWLCKRLSESGLLPADAHYDFQNMLVEYDQWVKEMRQHVASVISGRGVNLLLGPYSDVNYLRDEHPFIAFMFNLNGVVSAGLGFLVGDPSYNTRSQQLFARLLCIHPRAVQSYIVPRASADLPPVLWDALIQAGVSTETLTELKRQVALFQVRKYPDA